MSISELRYFIVTIHMLEYFDRSGAKESTTTAPSYRLVEVSSDMQSISWIRPSRLHKAGTSSTRT